MYSAFETKSTIHELSESAAARFKESRRHVASLHFFERICKSRNLQQVVSPAVSQLEEVIFASHMTLVFSDAVPETTHVGPHPGVVVAAPCHRFQKHDPDSAACDTRVVMESMIGCHVVSTLLLLPVREVVRRSLKRS